MSKAAKGLLGIVIWIVLGFLVYSFFAGMGAVVYFIFHYMPWYHIVFGTLAGCIIVFFYYIADIGDKK